MLRVVSYNIHKGVQGLGPLRRLEIQNLAQAVRDLQADIVCLQEVRAFNRKEARWFAHWPVKAQTPYLAPPGYHWAYHTNAVTRHGEHGNALLSRWPVLRVAHEDMSDHRFEQRGLLHAVLDAPGQPLHVLVLHLGLIRGSRARQAQQVLRYVAREVPADAPLLVAGDFNDWGAATLRVLRQVQLKSWPQRVPTFPSRWPLAQLDHVLARGLHPVGLSAPRGAPWSTLSDHLPVVAEFAWPARSLT
ncbi:MAG: endonuclease/exonuclease/phosphatase family protein [Rhodoferax sp.]